MCSGCQQKNRNFLASEVGVDSGAKLGELYFVFQENPFGILSQPKVLEWVEQACLSWLAEKK